MKAAVSQLGTLGLGVSDPQAWRTFLTDVLGLEDNGVGEGGEHLFRMDENHHRIGIREDAADDIAYAGWQTADAESLSAVARRLSELGAHVRWGTAQEAQSRGVTALFTTRDPSGITTEVYTGPLVQAHRPFRSPRGLRGFETGDLGLGHIVFCVADADASLRFYREGLGLLTSDYIDMDMGDGTEISVAFLHAGPRHHSLAIVPMATPKRLHHFMLQVTHVDDVGSTYDLCRDRDVPVARSLGRHTNDHMLSFYMNSPSGFEVEFGYGGLEIDDDWQVQRHRAPSIWGHRSP